MKQEEHCTLGAVVQWYSTSAIQPGKNSSIVRREIIFAPEWSNDPLAF